MRISPRHTWKNKFVGVTVLALTLAIPTTMPNIALADSVSDAKQAYDEASAKVDELTAQYDETQATIDSLATQISDLKDETNTQMRSSYKGRAQSDIVTLLSMVASSDDIGGLLQSLQYDSDVSSTLGDKISELTQKQAESESAKQQLQEDVANAQAAAEEANEKYKQTKEAKAAAAQKASSGTTVTLSTVDWSADKTAFVEEWSSRIDSYLSGSPLYGYGKVFASCAYDNNLDPRISPAISLVESSKGAVCFRPYNAWGLMGKSFSSWEESIAYDCQYMAGPLYNGQINAKTAQTYCPPTWSSWLSKAQTEMAKI